MLQSYTNYTELSINALKFNPRAKEVIDKKQEIFRSICDHYKSNPTSVLFYGFSPLMLGVTYKQIAVTAINDQIKNYLDSTGIKYMHIKEEDLVNHQKEFSWVVASEEYFTFAANEDEQRRKVDSACRLAKELVVTTLRDYKNQDFKEKEFSQPIAIRNNKEVQIFVEYHNYDNLNKNVWNTLVYEMQGNVTNNHGPFARSAMYFKQLAKFSIDAGAKNFYVHKNLMYKSLIKKNYEHVISISL